MPNRVERLPSTTLGKSPDPAAWDTHDETPMDEQEDKEVIGHPLYPGPNTFGVFADS